MNDQMSEPTTAANGVTPPVRLEGVMWLKVLAWTGIVAGAILVVIAFVIGSDKLDSATAQPIDMTLAEVAGRTTVAILAAASLTIGFLAWIAVGVLDSVRELLRRHRDGDPL